MPGMGLDAGNIVMNKVTKEPTQLRQIKITPNRDNHCTEKYWEPIKIGWPGKISLGSNICQP